jgi:hypothetical protein
MCGWIVAVVVAIVCVPVNAQSMHSTTALANGATASSQYAGSTLFFEWDGYLLSNPSNVLTFRASAIRLNDTWGLAPAHLFEQTGAVYSNFRVGNGSNWMTDRGQIRDVSQFFIHPQANPNGFDGNEVDLAVFRWNTPLSGTDVTIAPSVLNEVLSYNGFGRPATPILGILPSDGQRRMFQTGVDMFGDSFAGVSTDYVAGVFWAPNDPRTLALGGIATAGSSGSGVYNSGGGLVAMTTAGSGSPGWNSTNYSLRLDLYQPWINTVVPSPGSIALLGIGGLFAFRRRRM